MSYVITAPDLLATAAADMDRIGSAISAANAGAVGPTTGLVPAAEDEVSAAVAKLFGGYSQEYQAVIRQGAAFHSQFSQALAAAGNAYAQAEAANAAAVSNALGALSGPVQTLLGNAPAATATGSTGIRALASATAQQVALIMGGTGNPLPDPGYIASVNASYIQRLFPGYNPTGLTTPEQFWPVTPQLGNMTFGQSVAQGVAALNTAINTQIFTNGNSVVVFGYSQSATIATNEIQALMALPAGVAPDPSKLSFVLIGDPNNPNGGLLTRFPGFYIPFLDVPFSAATPPNSPYHTAIYTAQYDGIADAPQYPLHVLSDVNAFMGYFYVHSTYPTLTPDQVANAVQLPTSPGYSGNTQYYMLTTQDLPLLDPIRDIPYAGPPIADIFQPDLRVLVDLGYSDYGPGGSYANVSTPAGFLSVMNPFTVATDLAKGAVLGPYGAAVEIGVESGLLSPDLFPDIYPWVPSVDPGLHIFLGQPTVTAISVLSGALGDVFHHIPPVLN
jgi:PE-PPE domain/PE family